MYLSHCEVFANSERFFKILNPSYKNMSNLRSTAAVSGTSKKMAATFLFLFFLPLQQHILSPFQKILFKKNSFHEPKSMLTDYVRMLGGWGGGGGSNICAVM